MRQDTVTTDVYKFEELTDEAKQNALEELHDINTDYDWWNFVYEDTKEAGKLIGIDIDTIYFSGFSSQGDGACFEGSYAYKKGSVKAIKEFNPNDEELHSIVESLCNIQKSAFYSLTAKVKQRGRYMHENCTDIDVYDSRTDEGVYDEFGTAGELTKALRAFMTWIYKRLEFTYDDLQSEEAIISTIEANEYEFTKDGKLY